MTASTDESDVQIRLPEFNSTLPVKTHPHTTELVAASNQWVRAYLRPCARSDAELESLIDGGLARLTCQMLPDAPTDAVRATCDLWQQIVLLDDAMSDRGRLGGSIHAAQNAVGRLMTTLTGWGGTDPGTEAVRDVVSRLAPYLPRQRWERFVAEYADLLDGFLIEVSTRADDGLADFDAYVRLRRVTVGAKWLIILAELIPGTDLDHRIPAHPQLLELRDVALDHLWLVNDLFSFFKEQVGGEYTSAIPVLRRFRGQQPQEAVTWLFDQIAERERTFLRMRQSILGGEVAGQPGLGDYIANIGYIMAGTLHWHWGSSRYHVPGRRDPRGTYRPAPCAGAGTTGAGTTGTTGGRPA